MGGREKEHARPVVEDDQVADLVPVSVDALGHERPALQRREARAHLGERRDRSATRRVVDGAHGLQEEGRVSSSALEEEGEGGGQEDERRTTE